MTIHDLARGLAGFVENDPACERVQSFEDAGIMSSADGLVLSTAEGDEFQIMVVQTRYAPPPRHFDGHVCRCAD